jgi:uncharacterized membrane protein YidH (DUF202 family)
MTAPVDAGLQTERTLLAWQRTCMALAVAAAVAVRFTALEIGPVAAPLGLAALALVGIAWAGATRRYRRARSNLTADRGNLGVNGIPIAALAIAAVLIAIAACAMLIMVWLPR